jgi:hypothetical protein
MRKLLGVVTVTLLAFSSCGGGGGSTSTTSESSVVRGGVSASIVTNATVCLEDTEGNILKNDNGVDVCAQTDDNGTFQLEVPPDVNLDNTQIGLYAKDQNGDTVKIGEASYTSIKNITQELDPNATDVIDVNPLSLADGNQTLADDLGATMHALGGDTNGTASKIDFGSVDIENVTDSNGTPIDLEEESLENLLKQKHKLKIAIRHNKLGDIEIEIIPDNATAPVLCKIDTDGDGEHEKKEEVKYSFKEHEKEWIEHLKIVKEEHQHSEELEQEEHNASHSEAEEIEEHNNVGNHAEMQEHQSEVSEVEHNSGNHTEIGEVEQHNTGNHTEEAMEEHINGNHAEQTEGTSQEQHQAENQMEQSHQSEIQGQEHSSEGNQNSETNHNVNGQESENTQHNQTGTNHQENNQSHNQQNIEES